MLYSLGGFPRVSCPWWFIFEGVVFVPEDEGGTFRGSYHDQVTWERDALAASDCVLFWVPRELKTMPAFTTNVELSLDIRLSSSGQRSTMGRCGLMFRQSNSDSLWTADTSNSAFANIG